MDKGQRKLLRSPSLKRKSKVCPVGQKLTLERVLGLTVSSNAAFSCDPVSGTIAYPAGCVVVLFNPRRNRQSHIFNVSKKTITALAFSGDGKHLVTGECGHQPAVRLWDVEEKTQVAEFHGHKFGINCVAFSPNLKYIVSIGSQHDMMVNVWNWRTGNKVASNKVSCKVSAVSFGADSSSFVTVGNRHVKFWYLDSSKSKINQTVPLSGRSGILGDQKNNFFCDVVCGRGASANSTFVITQSGLLCEFNEKRLLDKWVELRTNSASCLAAGEEHIFIGCAEGVVRVFSSNSLCFIATLPHPHCLGVDVAAATSSSDMICTRTDAKYPDVVAVTVDDDHKKVACVYNDHSLYVWDVVNVKRVGKAWSFLFHSGCIWALEVYPALENKQTGSLPLGSFLTASSDDTIRIWNLDPQMTETSNCRRNIYSSELLKIVYTEPSHNFLCDVNYNPAGATDKTDTNWDGKNGVRSIRISPDGEHLASGDRQGNIRIYDLRSMAEIRSIEAHESDVVCLEYSFPRAGPKILASGSRDRLIHVFDVEQHYGLLQTLDDHSAAIQSVRFTDANNRLRMLSCGSDKSLLFRNASLTPGFEFSLDQHLVSKATMYDMVIDPTQKYLATACQDRNLRVYNMATAKQRRNYRASAGDEGTLLRVQLDPSGTYAATSCTDKNLCILEFYTGELLATAFGHSEISTGLRFTNDLKHLISVSADGCIFVWRLTADMTKTMRSRMEELGKMPQEEVDMSDLRREVAMMPNPVSLDATFTAASLPAYFPIRRENVSPSRGVLASMGSDSVSSTSYPVTPTSKRPESATPLAQPSPAEYRFSVGPLPNWAKAKFGAGVEGSDGEPDTVLPKGRWAQRFDQNLAFKSQLDLSQLDDETDSRRFTAAFESGGLHSSSGLHGGDLAASMPDLRRETVVLSQQMPAPKNIPIIDDDDEINVDDEEDFFPAFMKDKLLKGPGPESDRSSSDPPDDGRRQRKNNSSSRLSEELGGRRYGNRVSFGSEHDRTAGSLDLEDTDDIDSWSDTTEIIYPPSEPESVDPLASTFQVFAADGSPVKAKQRIASVNNDEDSESTDLVSLEEDEDQNDETLVTSTPSTPSDQEKDFTCPRTPDKELFLKENFESVTFTPVAMEKFVQQVATLEQAAEASDSTSVPFSPRLSLSSKFLSRSHFGPIRGAVGFGGFQQRAGDNWFDPRTKTKSDMARAMDETRRCLTDKLWRRRKPFVKMSWKAGAVPTRGSPDNEDPPSPPTRLDNKEPSFATHKNSSQANSTGIKETSPPPALPSTGVPVSPTTTLTNSSRSAGVAAVLGTKDRRRTSNGQVNGASGTTAAQPLVPRQVPSYFKTTKASRMKSSSTNNLHKAVDAGRTMGSGGVNAAANTGGKIGGPAKKRAVNTKGGLSTTSKFSTYASTPNLASFQEEEEEETARSSPQKTSPASNLRSLQELSISVPDVNLIDDPTSTDSSSSSSGPVHKEKKGGTGRLSSPTRRALPGGSLGVGKDLKLSLAPKGRGELTDNQLMPPPGAPPLSRAAHTTVIRRPITTHKRPTVELTLEQAKSILTGNSGILGSRQSPSPDDDSSCTSFSSSSSLSHSASSVGQKPGMARRPTDSTSSESSQRTLSFSTQQAASSRTTSTSRNSSSSSGVLELTEAAGYVPASTLAVAEEIDRTANQLRRERERIAAAALDASRYDPPERDQPSASRFPSSPQLSCSVQLSSNKSSVDGQPPAASFSASSLMSIGAEKEMSVRERIALLNQNTPKRGSVETGHISSRSHSPSPVPPAHNSVPQVAVTATAASSPPSNEQHVSPRSQSDTGLGSDTDTDSELRQSNDLPRQAIPSGEANCRGDRSRLTLQLQDSGSRSASPSSAGGPEALQMCKRVVGELTSAVQRAKDFHAQMKSHGSNGSTSTVQQQMMSMMSEAFRDAHLALAHLVLQSPVASGDDGGPSSLSCPLVSEGAWAGTLQDKTRDMIQPFLSHLSQELAQELAKVIRDRVKDKSSPS